MDWDQDYIRLYLDDELLNEIDLSKTFNGGYQGNTENPFANTVPGFKHYILLNLAIGSNGGQPDTTRFPLRYHIDYVRVYQK
jgi:beta-glucanase (GH16 family)